MIKKFEFPLTTIIKKFFYSLEVEIGGGVNLYLPPYNETVKSNIKRTGTTGSYSYATMDNPQQFKCNTQTTDKVKIKLAEYMIKVDVFNALAYKYIEVPMLFPIHICQIRDFTQQLKNSDTYDTAATIELRHCDTLFTVFRINQYSRTCFINPQIDYSFNIDGKIYPREVYKTVDDPRNLNMMLDALNLNGSLLSSINNDIKTSVQPYYYLNKYNATGVNTQSKVWHGKDNSNFFIGLPFAEGEDFQGGISTAGTVQIELRGNRLNESTNVKNIEFTSPVGIYFEDALLKIRAMQPPGRPQIEITNASIEQVIASQGR